MTAQIRNMSEIPETFEGLFIIKLSFLQADANHYFLRSKKKKLDALSFVNNARN